MEGWEDRACSISQRAHCPSGHKTITMTHSSQLLIWVAPSSVILKQDNCRSWDDFKGSE